MKTTLLQADSLQISAGTIDIPWGAIIILGILILGAFSFFSLKRDLAKSEEKRRYKEYLEKVKKIQELSELKKQKIPFFKVKGVTSYELKKPGCYICKLIAEPENQYDLLAVKIEHPTLGTIGYLPRNNAHIHNLAKEKELLGAVEVGLYKETPFAKLYIDPAYFTAEDIAKMEEVIISK